MVAWMAVPSATFRVTSGEAASYTSPAGSTRYFCGNCGTPLYFVNEEMLPGIVDIQSVTLDQPDAVPPQVQIQVAERRAWMADLESMPQFERFPAD